MLKHMLTIAFRSVRKHRSSFFINLVGLSTGLAFAFLLYLWVQDERAVDKFHANDETLYQVLQKSTENGQIRILENTQGPLSEAMEKDLPEVEKSVTVMNLVREGMDITMKSGEESFKSACLFSSRSFFEVFTFPLIQGESAAVLKEKNSVVISEAMALKLFGTTEAALGKPIEWSAFGVDHLSAVTGVFKNVDPRSTLQFDVVLTKQKLIEDVWTNGASWNNTGPQTYLLLTEGVDVAAFNKKIERYIDRYQNGNIFSLFLRKYSDAYLYGNYENGEQAGGRITYVRLFSAIAFLLLLIASINFMNLSTAKVTGRMKEIGIKKLLGSGRRSLIYQFLGESILVTFVAAAIALFLASVLMPQFNFITGKQLALQYAPNQLFAFFSLTLITGILAGSYPALYLSGFKPLTTLKGKLEGKIGEFLVRKGLVIFQFVVSFVLIVSVLIVYQQIEFARNKPVGYEKEHVVYFNLEGKAFEHKNTLFEEIKKVPGVIQAGGISQTLITEDGGASTYGLEWPGKDASRNIDFMVRSVDENLIPTLGIHLDEGKTFSNDLGDNASYLLLNETAAAVMGLTDPVGTKVTFWGEEKTVLGVVKDFHTASIHQPIAPLVFYYNPEQIGMAMVRIREGSAHDVIAELHRLYSTWNSGYTLDLKFLEESFRAQYLAEEQTLVLAKYFALLTILISCLGLFGLAAFDTERRTKEIGIRKVLGAPVAGIVQLLSKDFVKLVLAAIVIASPLAWGIMHSWLQGFAYRIDIQWWMFAAAGLVAVVIAVLTVGAQAVKAAVANPVDSLRDE